MIRLAILGAFLLCAGNSPADDGIAPLETFTPEQRSHWAYRLVARPDPPTVKLRAWTRNPIDRFILAATEELSLRHASEADRITLIRRVTYDLTGLPPSPDEVFAFLSDPRANAYECLVDRLLASPRYGERWTQHWLDLAHYADSNGFELDGDRPDAWRYRDWVVKALNDDMPYDRFVTLQIAGEEAEAGSIDALIATGFGRCGPREVVGGNVDPAANRQSELTEITSTVGSVFLGLTMGCARCHDHKFDALPTTDYYRLQSFFASSDLVDRPIATKAEEESYNAAVKLINEKVAPLRARMSALEAPYRKALREKKQAMLTAAERTVLAIPDKERTPAQKKLAEGTNKALNVTWEEVAAAVRENPADHAAREYLKREVYELERTKPQTPAKAMALIESRPKAAETFVLRRGDVKARGPKVAPRPPGVLLVSQKPDAFSEPVKPPGPSSGRRLALARWMTRPDNPLTSRVIVNRLWMHHFGRGLVASTSDFGVRGESPTHPELLDWLASEFVAGGWRLKPIHRLMVTSATYRQSSRVPAESSKKAREDDPENSYLWRMNRRRMDAEGLRDAMLFVAGDLNPKSGGPGVLVPIEKEVKDLIFTEAEVVDLWPETADPAEHRRRSLYLFRKRNVRYPMFDAFDAPDTQISCPQRGASIHALQPLVTLNSRFALDRAESLVGRVHKDPAWSEEARIAYAYQCVLDRDPIAKERSSAREFLDSQSKFLREKAAEENRPLPRTGSAPLNLDPARMAAWVDLALALLNRNEFLYVP
ncbi:MAG: hypothetical protein JWN86_3481 [Planctomycetota bacterium]|nr:hypothetical protein [Planctomycetota bacterium]